MKRCRNERMTGVSSLRFLSSFPLIALFFQPCRSNWSPLWYILIEIIWFLRNVNCRGWGEAGGVMKILIPGQCKDLFSSFLLDVKSRHKLENKNSTLAWFGGAGLAPEVWYILVFLLLFFLHKWYILISILIYFESLFDMGWWLFICS